MIATLPAERAARHSDFVDLAGPACLAGIAVHRTASVNSEETLTAIRAAAPDLCLVIGWSEICRAPFREAARFGAVGFHPSALPRLRGRAVIPWTILLGERETGSTLFWLDEGLDTGDVLLQHRFAVASQDTARDLYDRHLRALSEMLPEAVRRIGDGVAPRLLQDHASATWCARRTAEDGRIDWHAPAADVLRLIRATGDPYPGAFTDDRHGRIALRAAPAIPDWHRYVGLPAQVQAHTAYGFAVLCGDGMCIEATEWRSASGRRPKLHDKLGELPA